MLVQGYSLVDPWMDGQLRFGGGYSNWVNTTDPDRLAILDLVKGYSGSVAAINTKSAGTDTCVWYAPPKMGQGCKCVPPPSRSTTSRQLPCSYAPDHDPPLTHPGWQNFCPTRCLQPACGFPKPVHHRALLSCTSAGPATAVQAEWQWPAPTCQLPRS